MTGRIVLSCTLAVLVIAAVGCATTNDTISDRNRDLIREFTDLTNQGDWDGLSELVTEDFVRHSAATAGPPITSRASFIELQKGFAKTFPDQRIDIRMIISEGDHVAVLANYSGTQLGPMGDFPATGRKLSGPFIAIFRIEGNQVAELWVEWDNVDLLRQLGLFPPPQ